MDEPSERLLEAINRLEEVANSVTPEDAARGIEESTLQVFWRDWPHLSAWAGALWRHLNEDLAEAGAPATDPDLDESGGGD